MKPIYSERHLLAVLSSINELKTVTTSVEKLDWVNPHHLYIMCYYSYFVFPRKVEDIVISYKGVSDAYIRSHMQFLISKGYLRELSGKNLGMIEVTPRGRHLLALYWGICSDNGLDMQVRKDSLVNPWH